MSIIIKVKKIIIISMTIILIWVVKKLIEMEERIQMEITFIQILIKSYSKMMNNQIKIVIVIYINIMVVVIINLIMMNLFLIIV
jgi:hypothetical protein